MQIRTSIIATSCIALAACSGSSTAGGDENVGGSAGAPSAVAGRTSGGAHSGGAHSGGAHSGGNAGTVSGYAGTTSAASGIGGSATGGANTIGGTTTSGANASGGLAVGGSLATGGVDTSGGTPSGGNLAIGGAVSNAGTPAAGGEPIANAGAAGLLEAGASALAGSTGVGGASACAKTQGSDAGTVCAGCGWQVKTYYNCDGSRYAGTQWHEFSDNPLCITAAHCGSDAAYWVRNAAGPNGATCAQFCEYMGATCADECTAFGSCPASTSAGYNQHETYGCDSQGATGNQCSSSVAHASNAYNAYCCCRGLSSNSGGTSCAKTEGSEAGSVCVACGLKVKTYFHCDGSRYVSSSYVDYTSDALCVSAKLCNDTTGPAWTRNTSGHGTCDHFCTSVNAKCVNACTAFSVPGGPNPCPQSTDAGYNQYETYGCESGSDNQCNSPVQHPDNAYNAYCCCQVL